MTDKTTKPDGSESEALNAGLVIAEQKACGAE